MNDEDHINISEIIRELEMMEYDYEDFTLDSEGFDYE